MPLIRSGFRPAWWLRGPHRQTLWPFLFRPPPLTGGEQERLDTEDGDFLDLAWFGPADGPVVLLLHGLEGGLGSHYVRRTVPALTAAGYRACVMQFRGCSGVPNRLARSYHSGDTADLAWVLDRLRASGRGPGAVVGFSLGGNVLLKWLGEQGADSGVACAVAISVPFRLGDAADRMATGLSRIYQRYLIDSLVTKCAIKFRQHPAPTTTPLRELRTFRLFDDQVTAPLHGFAGVDDYYRRSSSRQYLPRIATPTLILHAEDDPFMYPLTAPTADELPDAVIFELARHGGHVGFVSGRWPWRTESWFVQRILAWLAQQGAQAAAPT